MSYSYEWHDSFIHVTCLIHTCDMTHSYVWHDSITRVIYREGSIARVYILEVYVWHDSFICVTWLIHMCDITQSYVWHDSIARVYILEVLPAVGLHNVTWLIHVWYDSIMRVVYLWGILAVAWRSVAWRCWIINTQKSHMYIQKKPINTQKKPINTQKKPINTQKSHIQTIYLTSRYGEHISDAIWCPQDVRHILEVLRLMCVKRDLCVWKETYVCRKRPTCDISWRCYDLCVWKETYVWGNCIYVFITQYMYIHYMCGVRAERDVWHILEVLPS